MTPPGEISGDRATSGEIATRSGGPVTPANLALLLVGLTVCFGQPLYGLALFSLHSSLYSHILLIPCISGYLVWIQWRTLPAASEPNRPLVSGLLASGTILLGIYWAPRFAEVNLAREDSLALLMLSYVAFFIGICGWFLGSAILRALAFPFGFLVFMAPFPVRLVEGIETFLQHASAGAAQMFFRLSGTTVFHHDLIFQLPGITLEVAPECSGIHSSLALFITSLVAGHFFLRKAWKSALLSVAVIPLAILRNGFRIFTIGELCVQVSPDMINHWIHRQGGPVFFALSLVPFFILLRILYKSDHPNAQAPTRPSQA